MIFAQYIIEQAPYKTGKVSLYQKLVDTNLNGSVSLMRDSAVSETVIIASVIVEILLPTLNTFNERGIRCVEQDSVLTSLTKLSPCENTRKIRNHRL